MNGSHAVRPKIVREVSSTSFDIVYNGATVTHPGGGYADMSVANGAGYVVPSDGFTYRSCVATSYTPGVPDAWGSVGARSMVAGDVTGTGVAMVASSDGSLPFRWTSR
jgi:hypothetical protein